MKQKTICIAERLMRAFYQLKGEDVLEIFRRPWTCRGCRAIAVIIYDANHHRIPELVAICDHLGENFGTTDHMFAWNNNVVP